MFDSGSIHAQKVETDAGSFPPLYMTQVALDAANEAFNTSAGRLRKLYAIEKLSGNLDAKQYGMGHHWAGVDLVEQAGTHDDLYIEIS